MRIHLPLHPHHFTTPSSATAGSSSSPLAQLGGEIVLLELQGELKWDGDNSNGVIGVLGLDRPDKPTLHLGEHHLLHGKISTLSKPYAIIRRAVAEPSSSNTAQPTVDGDAEEEESDKEHEEEAEADLNEGFPRTPAKSASEDGGRSSSVKSKLTRNRVKGEGRASEEEDEEEPPLFSLNEFETPARKNGHPETSSPFYPSSAPRDYSSELDPSSPAQMLGAEDADEDEADVDENMRELIQLEKAAKEREDQRKKRRRIARKENEKTRTRYYEVIGVVRKKVVFALRPEPIVTATVLPE